MIKVTKDEAPASTIAEFSYDFSGNRLKKIASGKTTVYIDSLYEKDSDGATRKHIFLGATRICTRGLSPTGGLSLSFYHSDHLGSSNVITDVTGKQIQLTEYRPFGSLTKGLPTAGAVPDYLYTGKELDRPTNLYYYGARYYNADLGKFIQPDPLIQDVYDPQTLNHYAYCRNNPLILTDPDGMSWESTFSSWGSSISSGWNSFNSWASSSYNSAMNSFNRSMDSIQRSINSFTTQAMTSFSSIGQSVWSETKIWGNAFSTGVNYGLGQAGSGIAWAGKEYMNFQMDMLRSDTEIRTRIGQQAMAGLKYQHNNLCNNGYVEAGGNFGLGTYGATASFKFSKDGIYFSFGGGPGIAAGIAATYNIGPMPSVGSSYSGSACGGYIVGARYRVAIPMGSVYSNGQNGVSTTVGVGVGFGIGKNMAVTHTIKLWPEAIFLEN